MFDPNLTAAAGTDWQLIQEPGKDLKILHRSNPDYWFYIQFRPHYCDRGRYLVHAEKRNQLPGDIDGSDLFPRYYFFPDCMFRELAEWVRFRTQQENQLD